MGVQPDIWHMSQTLLWRDWDSMQTILEHDTAAIAVRGGLHPVRIPLPSNAGFRYSVQDEFDDNQRLQVKCLGPALLWNIAFSHLTLLTSGVHIIAKLLNGCHSGPISSLLICCL